MPAGHTVAAAERQTLSVPEAGRRLGIGRNHAYECARRGDLPVIRLGHKLVVPLAALERMLALGPSQENGASGGS